MNLHLELNSIFLPVWTDSCNTNTPNTPTPSKPTQLATLLPGWSKRSGRTLEKNGGRCFKWHSCSASQITYTKGKAEPNTYTAVRLLISWISLSVFFFLAFVPLSRIPKCSVFNALQTYFCMEIFLKAMMMFHVLSKYIFMKTDLSKDLISPSNSMKLAVVRWQGHISTFAGKLCFGVFFELWSKEEKQAKITVVK